MISVSNMFINVLGVHQQYSGYAQTGGPAASSPNFYSVPSYGATHTTTIIVPEPEVIIVGACPACRVGILEEDFTCLGLLCAILFFPIGLLCCLLLREKKCTNCGATFS